MLPKPTVVCSPIVTPFITFTPLPSHTCLPMTTGFEGFNGLPCRSVIRWVSDAQISTFSANIHSSPISTRLPCPISTILVLSSIREPLPTVILHPFPFINTLIIALQPSYTTSLSFPIIFIPPKNIFAPLRTMMRLFLPVILIDV